MEIREIHLVVQEINRHAGRSVDPPSLRVAACAVLSNPRAGQPAGDDFEAFVNASVEVGGILSRRALDALGGRKPMAYGKGALVGPQLDGLGARGAERSSRSRSPWSPPIPPGAFRCWSTSGPAGRP